MTARTRHRTLVAATVTALALAAGCSGGSEPDPQPGAATSSQGSSSQAPTTSAPFGLPAGPYKLVDALPESVPGWKSVTRPTGVAGAYHPADQQLTPSNSAMVQLSVPAQVSTIREGSARKGMAVCDTTPSKICGVPVRGGWLYVSNNGTLTVEQLQDLANGIYATGR